MRPQVLIEKEILDRLAEGPVVGDALVQVEIRVDDLLDDVLDFLIKGEVDVLAGIRPGTGVKGVVAVETPIIWLRVTRCSGPRCNPKRSFSSPIIRESASISSGEGP